MVSETVTHDVGLNSASTCVVHFTVGCFLDLVLETISNKKGALRNSLLVQVVWTPFLFIFSCRDYTR